MAFDYVLKADTLIMCEVLQKDFDKPLLATAFLGLPMEASYQLNVELAGFENSRTESLLCGRGILTT